MARTTSSDVIAHGIWFYILCPIGLIYVLKALYNPYLGYNFKNFSAAVIFFIICKVAFFPEGKE